MTDLPHRIDTQLIHAGEPRPRIEGAVSLPIFQSSTFEYGGQGQYDDLRYIRLNNTPNHVALGRKLAVLEGAEAALVTGSGMAAISAVLLTLLSPGDHLIAQNGLYGGTHAFIAEDLSAMGIGVDWTAADDPAELSALIRPTTRLVYVETMTNPLIEVADLPGIAAFCRDHGLVSVIDNTFATPVNFRPVGHGFDLSIHSATKYLNGHSDIVAGAVIGKSEMVSRITRTLNHLGGTLDPHACFLLHRGLKTLAVRIRHQNASALAIARFLADHPEVEAVHYPGLPEHPSHAWARSLLAGFGGMLSFRLRGDVDRADRFIRNTTLPLCAPSLGGVETLITRPATTSHSGMSATDRRAVGIDDELIRLSVGLEATEDLIADFRRAVDG